MDAVRRFDEFTVGVTTLLVGGEDAAMGLGVERVQDLLGASLEGSAGRGVGEVGNHEESVAVVIGDL